jgi:hypothetical protein
MKLTQFRVNHSNELASVYTLHERKLCGKSRKSDQSFVSVQRVYYVNIDNTNIFMQIYEV